MIDIGVFFIVFGAVQLPFVGMQLSFGNLPFAIVHLTLAVGGLLTGWILMARARR